jgi:hypothetical protein
MSNHSYEIKHDDTLILPDAKKMKIIEGTVYSMSPLAYCKKLGQMSYGTIFLKTIDPIRVYKKTGYYDGDKNLKPAITELIVPPGTQFRAEHPCLCPVILWSLDTELVFEKAIVNNQFTLPEYEKICVTVSIYDNEFSYVTGELVKPTISFCDYDTRKSGIKMSNGSMGAENHAAGIHAYASKDKAIHYFSNIKHAEKFKYF